MNSAQKKKWLWLLLIPTGVIALPFILIGMMIGTRLLSIVIGPVNVWNTTVRVPPIQDIAGFYELSDEGREILNLKGIAWSKQSGFRLAADHSLEISDVPAFDGSGYPKGCYYNGTGIWSLQGSGEVWLDLNIGALGSHSGFRPSCNPENLGGMQLLGHSAPYRFWYWIGDPDEDQGLIYLRRR